MNKNFFLIIIIFSISYSKKIEKRKLEENNFLIGKNQLSPEKDKVPPGQNKIPPGQEKKMIKQKKKNQTLN